MINKIVEWHHARNLIDGATDKTQFMKLISEFGELSDNMAQGACIKDDIGDMAVVLINIAERNACVESLTDNHLTCVTVDYQDLLSELDSLSATVFLETRKHYQVSINECLIEAWEALKGFAKCQGLDFNQCLDVAYNDIKNRTGKMINGCYVKDA